MMKFRSLHVWIQYASDMTQRLQDAVLMHSVARQKPDYHHHHHIYLD